MDEYRREAFRMLLSSCTEHRTDRQRALIAFQACSTPQETEWVRELYLARRFAWINSTTANQRKWQCSVSKNPAKGRHHDSWAIREQYMRCHGSYHDHMPYARKVRDNG